MNKALLLSLSVAIFGYAQDFAKVGLGVVTMQQPYKGTKGKVLLLPYLEAKHKGFYIRGLETGYEYAMDGGFTFGGFAKGRLDGYKGSDSDDLNGMQERTYALEGGIKASFGSYDAGRVSAFASNDISGVHNGYELGVEYSKMFIHEKSTIIPYVSLKKESKKLTDYYYGVKNSEATPQRAEYSPKGAVNTEIGVRYMYKVSDNIDFIGGVSYAKLDEEIHKSPIVKDKERFKLFAACGYKF